MKYNPKNEHKVDTQGPEIQSRIAEARALYQDFVRKFSDPDLRDEDSINRVYEEATKRGVFEKASQIRELLFGRDTTTYGVSYISDSCVSGCTYCPIRKDSINVETGKPIKRKRLSLDGFIKDTEVIIKDGHSHICFLAGDGDLTTKYPERIIPYLQVLDQMGEVDEIILNVTPQTTETFKTWKDAVKNKSLQFRVFQETYNLEIYKQKHPFGPKADYNFRRASQSRAMDAGFDNYGFGVLLGLNPHFVQELEDLVRHTQELTAKYNKPPARICLPTANTLKGVNNVEEQIHVLPQANELAYALSKLAMPEVSIVSSERDTPEMLRILDRYATNRTVDVQPCVGGNLQQILSKDTLLKQTTVHSTSPKSTEEDYAKRGYNLLLKYYVEEIKIK